MSPTPPTRPRFPVYIPSKSRAGIATTPVALQKMGVPFRIVVEEHQHADYAAVYGAERLLILDPEYQRSYEALIDLEEGESRGSGPARNFIWDHSIGEGHSHHWIMDDNIKRFARWHRNQRVPVGDGMIFHAMEDFTLRYTNIGQAGPEYYMFRPPRRKGQIFERNRRLFSCMLIRNDVGVRWRGRYNEDLLLSIAMLQAGWCTVKFLTFLQDKLATQQLPGGNTEAFYAHEGTLRKSLLAVREHPDIVKLAWKYGRPHHVADFSEFDSMHLVKRPDYVPPPENPYRMKLVKNR